MSSAAKTSPECFHCETSHEMGQIALSIAASDGVISGKEVAALERLYTAIGPEDGRNLLCAPHPDFG